MVAINNLNNTISNSNVVNDTSNSKNSAAPQNTANNVKSKNTNVLNAAPGVNMNATKEAIKPKNNAPTKEAKGSIDKIINTLVDSLKNLISKLGNLLKSFDSNKNGANTGSTEKAGSTTKKAGENEATKTKVDTGEGDDKVNINGSNFENDIKMGAGDDQVFTGGSGNKSKVDLGSGDDEVIVNIDSKNNELEVHSGSGQDAVIFEGNKEDYTITEDEGFKNITHNESNSSVKVYDDTESFNFNGVIIDNKPENEEPGNNEPQNDEPGNNEPQNDEPGNNEPQNDEPGNNEPNNKPTSSGTNSPPENNSKPNTTYIPEDSKGEWGDPHFDLKGSNGERIDFDHKGVDGHTYNLFSGDGFQIDGKYAPYHDTNNPQVVGEVRISTGNDMVSYDREGNTQLNGQSVKDGIHKLDSGSLLSVKGEDVRLISSEKDANIKIKAESSGITVDPEGDFNNAGGIIGTAVSQNRALSNEECDQFDVTNQRGF